MMEQSKLDYNHELTSQTNYSSEFFPNFNDHSQFESSQSSISQQSTLQNNNDMSINDQKLKQFQMQNLIFISQTITKRIFINKWINNKDRINRIANITPNNLTKIFLKVFYSISVKLQVKYSMAFRKILKLYQEKKNNTQQQTNVNSNKQIEQQVLKEKGKERAQKIKLGCQKAYNCIMNINKRHWFAHYQRQSFNCLSQYSQKLKYLQFIQSLFRQDDVQLIWKGWQGIRAWINYKDKIDILEGTLSLLVHQKMRQALWVIKTQRPTLQYNDISNIQQTKSRKESMKMNNSSESLVLQKELLQGYKIIQNRLAQQQSEIEENPFNKKELPQFIQRSNPRHLKFTKDVKRKTHHTNSTQQEIVEQIQNDTIQPSQPQQSSIIKPQNEDLSMIRRGCATMNSSLYQSRSVLKKIFNPIELNLEKSLIVSTQLCDDDLPFLLNDGKVNKSFQNKHKVTKVKTLKHEEFRKEFTDFNDLFSVREILSFYQSYKTSGQEGKKGISLAKLKEKVNIKTQEEYYSRQKQMILPNEQAKTLHKIVSQPNIDLSSKIKRPQDRTYNSIKINNSQSRQRNYSNSKSRQKDKRSQFRIPKQLPKHFDYYIDKSLKKQQKILSPQLNLNGLQLKRKSISSKSRKKLQFNVVKSGGTRLSGEHQQRKKKSEIDLNKISSPNKPKIELHLRHISRQKRKSKQLSPSPSPQAASNCEYFMAFRDPPKKKIKKNIMKSED